MGSLGCSIDGHLNEGKFSQPLPWIGIYVAAASLACAIVMAADAIHCFWHCKFWFPCKFFHLNATTLTIIAVAIKLPLDINTPMPSRQDQLTKLSSAVLMCTIMGHTMPSLGTTENNEIFMNIMALGILVITLIVNICIQLGTGVIYLFWKEHALVMFLMLVLLVILSFSALTIPTTKHHLELKYNKKHELTQKESSHETDKPVVNRLREDLMKYWMMAHTSSPQFVMARSVTCTASGALSLLAAATLATAMARSYMMSQSFHFCSGESDYKWSTTLVLVIQCIAVGVGTIGPALRWFIAINFRCPKRGNESYKNEFRVEKYWIQGLLEIKECPLNLKIRDRRCRKFAYDVKIQFMDLCIRMQTGIVIMSKVIRLISICFVSRILLCCDFCRKLKKFRSDNSISNDLGSEPKPAPKLDLSRFVLHLEGEDQLVELMMKKNYDATEKWIQWGKKWQQKHLIKLFEVSPISQGFKGVKEFDSHLVPSLDSEKPPNCWALPVVALTSIAVALPNIKSGSIEQLIRGVNQGLMAVKLIESSLDVKKDLINVRKAAEVVWIGVDLYHKWLDVDLRKLALQGKSPRETLEVLADIAKNRYAENKQKHMNICLKEKPSKWPVKVLAANSLYRVSQTILLNYAGRNDQTGERLFEVLSVMISDILAACLSNVWRVISIKCCPNTIEKREESVRHATYLLGKTEKFMKIIGGRTLPDLDPDQIACIDEWCSSGTVKNPCFTSFPSENETASSTSGDLYLSIN